jgi:hypothetical protein
MIKATIMTKNLQHVSAVGIQFSAALSALGQNAAELQHALTYTENTLYNERIYRAHGISVI